MDNQKLKKRPRHGYGFIYCYTSPSGKKYIGQTRTSLYERAKKNGKGYDGCTAFANAIKKYGWENFTVEILAELPLDVLNEAEINYIIELDTTNREKGYNIATDAYNYLATISRIPVYSYDEYTGDFIERFDSIAAAEQAMQVHHGSIRRILNQYNHHVRHRIWTTEFLEQAPIVEKTKQPNSKHIYMYDSKTGELVAEYNSIREAARLSGYNRWTIQEHTGRQHIKLGKWHTFSTEKYENLFKGESSTTIQQE